MYININYTLLDTLFLVYAITSTIYSKYIKEGNTPFQIPPLHVKRIVNLKASFY